MITVNVSGGAGSGKSTIGYLIAEMLTTSGFEATFEPDEVTLEILKENIEERIASIRSKHGIIVTQTQLNRRSSTDFLVDSK